MADSPGLVLRRVLVRAGSQAQAQAVVDALRAGLAGPLAAQPGWTGGSQARLQLTAAPAEAGAAAAGALRRAIGGAGHG